MNETTLNGQSMDIVADNIQKLKAIFPDVFTEGKVDFEKLEGVLGNYIDKDNDRYNFTWHGKSQALRLAQTPSTGTLRPCREESKDWDTTQNLYIEGDNLEVLKLLQKSYHNKVKMIYIDPPYNTGNDFVYVDDFKDNINNYLEITKQLDNNGNRLATNSEVNGRYHTNWLSMIYPRLRLARNLLSEDGMLVISIDDNELDNLKKICDEVMGEENFLGRVIPVVNPGGRDYKQIAIMNEYLLIYAKSDATELQEIKKDIEFSMNDNRGGYEVRDLRNRNPKFHAGNRPNLFYPFYVNSNICDKYGCCSVSLDNKDGYNIEIYPYNSIGNKSVWRWGSKKANDNISINNIEDSQIVAKKKRDGGWTICEKNRRCTTKVKSIWDETGMRTEDGTRMIREIFGFTAFDHPKPIMFLKRIIELSGEEGIILDLFSGSSSMAQAVLEANSENDLKRKYIMIQLPEQIDEKNELRAKGYKTIADIGKDRIRLVGKRIRNRKDEWCDIGFRVLKLNSSNIKKWNPDYDNVEQTLYDHIDNFVEGRTELDVVFEIMLKYGIDLTMPIDEYDLASKKVYSVGLGALMICLDQDINLEIAQEITKLRDELQPEVCRVVFRDNGFKNDAIKTNVKESLKINHFDEIVSI